MRIGFRPSVRLAALLVAFGMNAALAADDPLPSWKDGASRKAILAFVAAVTEPGSPDFVAVPGRIAVFDNDGTLWCEQPMYPQAVFIRDRLRAMAPGHPEWKREQPFKALLEDDRAAVAGIAEKGLVDIVTATHAGMTSEEFSALVRDWIATARHPRFRRPYTRCVYQPMLELLAYLRAHGFETFLVSGGGAEFMRVWAEPAYGIPPDRVVGSTVRTRYELRGDTPVLMRLPEVDFVDDHAGKPVGIGRAIGRRPLAAFGNSDGDYEMLRYVTAGPGRRLGLIVHHTDADREYAYDRDSLVGRLARALDEAPARGWTVVDMRRDWKVIFPAEE
ncbi:haloacid dehalogenase-like hydrolase [Aquisphaera giovannonii]|uniref:Haloacid dehalogenase-like hydrolase n=1 Tax=Aquisphaera giovannonii TaxID=406548 RepID=A0A5B9WF91_9BACT|nr:HAD family hydrolase [Aquisphaera giovannonii]QEH38904.1 haloacid dehalogenase-like hydrolase [Aquisphaera giovannonii]